MAPTFEDFIQSPQFTFFVGQEGKAIVVHAAAIAAASGQLDALINSGMRESETRCAKIEDVRVEDFVRFCEYAYRGDYTVPRWEEDLPEPGSSASMNQQNGEEDEWASPVSRVIKKGGKKNKKVARVVPRWEDTPAPQEPDAEAPANDWPQEPASEPPADTEYGPVPISRTPLRTQFNHRTFLTDGNPKTQILQRFDPKPNTTANQNFTPVFLAHARLYSFAQYRGIVPLKALTLDKLHKTLMIFKLFNSRVGDIIELARFAYSDQYLPDRKDDGTIDDLRKLVVEYIVCEIDTIGKCDEFVKYMEEGGEFVGDFWRKIREYVV